MNELFSLFYLSETRLSTLHAFLVLFLHQIFSQTHHPDLGLEFSDSCFSTTCTSSTGCWTMIKSWSYMAQNALWGWFFKYGRTQGTFLCVFSLEVNFFVVSPCLVWYCRIYWEFFLQFTLPNFWWTSCLWSWYWTFCCRLCWAMRQRSLK